MNHIRKAAVSSKKFVIDHKVAIAVSITTVICVKLHTKAVAGTNSFLEAHGLLEEFYATEED